MILILTAMAMVNTVELMEDSKEFLRKDILLASTAQLGKLKSLYGEGSKEQFYSSFIVEVHSIFIRCKSVLSTYFNSDWWDASFPRPIKEKDRDQYIFREIISYKYSGFMSTFSRVESNFRIFAGVLGMKGTENFEDIQRKVLTLTDLEHYKEALDLSRGIRNLIHSAGIPNKVTKIYNYKSNVYTFEKGSQFTDYQFELNNSLFLDWFHLVTEITETPIWKELYPNSLLVKRNSH
jgi:hypothetical protein